MPVYPGAHNTRRPHSSLGMRAPAAFAAQWTTDDAALAA
jgi:transposase InsO family protein